MENKSNKELAKILRMYIKHQREKRANATWKQDPFMELLDICADRLEELEDKEDTYKRGEWIRKEDNGRYVIEEKIYTNPCSNCGFSCDKCPWEFCGD